MTNSREILEAYGYTRIVELGIEDVVLDKLSLKGFLRLMGYEEERSSAILREIQKSCNKRMEEK